MHGTSEGGYNTKLEFEEFNAKSEEVGKLLNFMINNPGKFGVQA